MGWNNKNCCCEPKTYVCADGEVNICCMTLEVSTWSQVLSLYARGSDPDDICSYVPDFPYYHNNHCGFMLRSLCGFPYAEIRWGIQADGTVRLTMDIGSTVDGDYNYVGPVSHTIAGLDPDTWYLSPLVFTLSGVTYTIEVCPDPHTPFPEWPLSTVYLKAAATALSNETRSTGSLLCGQACDPFGPGPYLQWYYNVYNDEITIGVLDGVVRVPYDNGDWIDNTHTVTVTVGDDTFNIAVSAVDSCEIPPPPPPCDVSNACFPDGCPCIVDGTDGSLYRTLTADISGPVTATGLTLIPYLAEGWDYSSGGDSIAIRCTNGGVDPYYVYVSVGGTVMFGSIPAGGFDCTPDGLDIVDITVTDGITTMVLYTL